MPSKQVSFFVLPQELNKIGGFIQNEMDGIFVFKTMNSPDLHLEYDINKLPYLGTSLTTLKWLSYIETKKLKDNLYSNDFTMVPCIDFSPGLYRKDENVLKAGRILVTSGFYNKKGEWEKHPEEFIQWADKLFKWIRKTYKQSPFPEFKSFRVSEMVVEWVNSENGKFEDP